MGFTAMLVGGSVGVACKGAMNRIMKVSPRRAPWEYVIGAGIGAYVGNKIPQWEARLVQDVDELRADRNLPAMNRAGGFKFGSSISEGASENKGNS